MKNITLFLILSCSTSLFAQKPKNDLKLFDFKGKVKSVKEVFFVAKDSFGIAVKSEKEYNKYTIRSFNNKGYLIEERAYKSGNRLKNKVIITFDKKGNKTEINQYYGKKEQLSFKQTREYNSHNKSIVLTNFTAYSNGDINLDAITKYKYDKKNRLIEENVFLPSGTLETKTLYKYDTQKKIVKLQNRYDSNGELSIRISEYKNPKKIITLYYSDGKPSSDNIYLFNKKEQNIEMQTSNLDGTASSSDKLTYNKYGYKSTQISAEKKFGTIIKEDYYKFSYEFDTYKNWTKKVISKNESFTLIIERQIEYY
ncbi:hypothetical protein [Psychroserpens sp. NJDZ02]|uniref:hypothetical protein n=1 Tax=Psychroserpens sp. NJDZ02 TaxID=2570561 RepID=UPI0010A7F480|nr:hypothetical protein [Psychroserpens sp. NJDZ02]QCE42762.1 hypothetical protein E9099_15540 [Psychroserpens sp. NJDZ02]